MRELKISVVVFALLFVADASRAAETTSCISCHGDGDYFEGELFEIVEGWREGVHADVDLGCHDCHGGNPDPVFADDPEGAMDPDFRENPYLGAPDRPGTPSFCGRCHSDPMFMKRFNPGARVDQESEYWTSNHGRALRDGNTKVATCVDCHGVHPILAAGDASSPVYPRRVADTCGRCHSDPVRMAGVTLKNGQPLPIDQQARWRRSVHAAAMFDRDDLSAPTCNDCHGNHGATPPGLDSIAFVCGQCHGREAALFRASAKQEGFEGHNELLADAGEEGCTSCHEPPDRAAEVTSVHAFTECVTCHGNHSVIRPRIAQLEPLPATPCAFCHEPIGSLTEDFPEPKKRQENYERMVQKLSLETEDLEGEERFNELVRRALQLEYHTVAGQEDGVATRWLKPEFERLFVKFRIGTTTFSYTDPITGEEVEERVVRCGDCHSMDPLLAESPRGMGTSRQLLSNMRELTVLTARAERMVLTARQGGVEVRDALAEIDQAVDSQIELEVLVHGFATGEGTEFDAIHAEGLEHVENALVSAQAGLDELVFRRRWLMISLVFIALVLVGLAMKIHSLRGEG